MRWVLLALLVFSLPSVLAVEPTISISSTSGPIGTVVSVSTEYVGDVPGELRIYTSPNDAPVGPARECDLTIPCQFSEDYEISGSTDFYSFYITSQGALDSSIVSFEVTDDTPPVFDRVFVPATGEISVSVLIDFEVTDDVVVENVTINFGDGNITTYQCDSSICREDDIVHRYELPGTYTVTFDAVDNDGLEAEQVQEVIEVFGELDSDSDGIPDEQDDCINTDPSRIEFVSSSGEAVGCACAEIDADDFDDGNLCTLESCVINADDELEILHEPVEDGSSPGQLQGVCQDGQYISSSCSEGDSSVCFGNLGNEHPFCFR